MVANENSAYKVMWLATFPTLLGTLLVDMGAGPIPELELGSRWSPDRGGAEARVF